MMAGYLKREKEQIPGKGDVFVTELMAGEVLDIIVDTTQRRPIGLRLLAAALVFEDGSKVYPNAEAAASELPFSVYMRLHPKAQSLNGLKEGEPGEV
jgi:hypothetical protein